MFPVLDPKELEKKIAELETVEHWLKANLNMLQLTIKSLQYQRAMLKGGEKFQDEMAAARGAKKAPPDALSSDNPAMWAWNMMSRAGETGIEVKKPATSRSRKKKTAR